MPARKSTFADKVLSRVGSLDAESVQTVVKRLTRERDFLDTLFNTIEDGVLVLDAQGRIDYFNQAVTRLLGLQADNATGEPLARYLPELDLDKLRALDRGGGRAGVRYEIEIEFPRPRFLRIFAAPLDGEAAGSAGLALILHDATDLREKTAEAIESERVQALTLLAGSVAHEIGNPLNALHIHLQLMERELRKLRNPVAPALPRTSGRRTAEPAVLPEDVRNTADKLDKFLGVAKGEIARLDYIVTQFLQALRPSPPKIQASSLNEVTAETLELLRPELENRGLLVEEKLARQLPEAPFDAAQIKQALVNLVKNAMQAMTRGGRLVVETGVLADGVWVSLADTGAGIPREQLTQLFQPYFTTKKKGTGLGLMIVYRIVRDHGGRIDVESQPERGTTFRIWLPLLERGPRLLTGAPGTVPSAAEPGGH
jgi:two-component system, sporulation sensor kinase E